MLLKVPKYVIVEQLYEKKKNNRSKGMSRSLIVNLVIY